MKPLVVYCHGYGSSATTDRVQKLRDFGFDVFAWDIGIDPSVSMPILEDKIDDLLIDHINDDVNLVFVGTSLGCWYASKLADAYGSKAILINPSYTPSKRLIEYGVPDEIAKKYTDTIINENDIVVVARDDEVIDHTGRDFSKAKSVIYSTGGHRFNGPEFDMVKDLI